MAHHTTDKPFDAPEELQEFMKTNSNAERELKRKLQSALSRASGLTEQETFGPTGDFPDGKIVPHDEGGLLFGVTVFSGCVVMDFGKPVRSIGFTRDQAEDIAKLLVERAKQCPPIIGKKQA